MDEMGMGAGEPWGMMGGSQPCNARKIALPSVFLESLLNHPLSPAVAQLHNSYHLAAVCGEGLKCEPSAYNTSKGDRMLTSVLKGDLGDNLMGDVNSQWAGRVPGPVRAASSSDQKDSLLFYGTFQFMADT